MGRPVRHRVPAATVRVEADLLAIPGEAETVVLFDRHRLVVQSLGDELATASPDAIQRIVAPLVERVETRDRQVVGWVPTGPAEPFVDSALLCGAPGRTRTADAGLRTASLCPLSYGGADAIVPPAGNTTHRPNVRGAWPSHLPAAAC